MEEIIQLILEIVLAYTRSEKHHYDALFESICLIFKLINYENK